MLIERDVVRRPLQETPDRRKVQQGSILLEPSIGTLLEGATKELWAFTDLL